MPASRRAPPCRRRRPSCRPWTERPRARMGRRNRSSMAASFQPLPRHGLQAAPVGLAALCHQQQSPASLAIEGLAAARSLGSNFGPIDQRLERFELLEQSVRLVGRIGQNLNVAVPVNFRLLRAGFLEDAMKIAAAEAEGADGRTARLAASREPRPGQGVQVERRPAVTQPLDRALNLRRGREHLVIECQRRLDETGGSRRGLGMADL